MPTRRFGTKLAIILGGVVLLAWKLPAILDMLLYFGATGSLPGWHGALSPTAELGVLATVLGLLVFWLARRPIGAVLGALFRRGQEQTPATPIPAGSLPVTPAEKAAKASARVRRGSARPQILPIAVLVMATARLARLRGMSASRPAMAARRAASRTATILRAAAARVMAYARQALAWLRPCAAAAARGIAYRIRQAARFTEAQMRQFWQWLRPYLERFDKWLERKAKRSEGVSLAAAVMRESAKSVREWLSEARRRMSADS